MSTIILFASRKGGAGKSTICTNLAAALANHGEIPLLFDADEQTTSSDWCADRLADYPDAPTILNRQDYGEVDGLLESLDNTYILCDTAGHSSIEMRSALVVADILLCPFKTSQADLNTMPYMAAIVSEAQTINPKLKALAFITMAPPNPKMKAIEQARSLIAEYPEFTLLDTVIYYRDAYVSSIGCGLGVMELQDNSPSALKAINEIDSLLQEVNNHG